jgi:signal transduction histidine kinase
MPVKPEQKSDRTALQSRRSRNAGILNRVVLYTGLMILIACGYALLVSGISLILGRQTLNQKPWIAGLLIFIIALAALPLHNILNRVVDDAFARRAYTYQEKLQVFDRELRRATDLNITLRLLRQAIHDVLVPEKLHIFFYEPATDVYLAAPDHSLTPAKPTSDLRFTVSSALVQALANQHKAINLDASSTLPAALETDQARIALLGALLFVPITGRQRLLGWVALGPRHAGVRYKHRELEFLESICDQAALAIERSLVIADLDKQIQAMRVLTRVSQGVNITLSFDDTLELIYTQTNNILPTRDFHICLYDRANDFLYPVFYLENDERLQEYENRPIPFEQGLERDVLTNRRGFGVDDYELECRKRGKRPAGTGIYSWVGVPLNTGAETIGVLSLASRDTTVYYTSEQVNLLQAIADQAAGAIVKARLLQEAERRTRQLTSLNEVTRSLTSTLDLEPLLNQILTSAVDILNCEAGSLLLQAVETGELVFEVTVGPVAAEIHGTRLPSGAGLAGRSVELHQPIIQNDVHRSQEWFADIEEETGFITRDILVVPMLVKEQCLGAIEVINRIDGLPFTQDDQELLMAFASQAGVALENARLYTQTDQTLAARVDELSIMQRIDRELNASLDVARTMRITLDWAMRQSKAEAGLVGIVSENQVHIMADQGYSNELDAYPEGFLPVDISSIEASLDTGQPQFYLLNQPPGEKSSANPTILKSGKAQLVLPIHREVEVIGLILLESKNPITYPIESLAFLSRLSDHAAIAISNAQLYAAVQAANLAKSDFVSFVSHELKTPMTSIRGFTDLLASGTVGQVNDAQGNFLSTIRSNVDRMATLVSDLADVSRIEANRLRLNFQEVELTDIIDDVMRSAHTQIEVKGHSLALEIPTDLPNLWGDRVRLIQVLTNLVNNAYKYTPQGGSIRISAELAENQWDPGGAQHVVHITVQDNGIGISTENQPKIFQKFFRAEDQSVRDIPGTGLGLNITKTLIEMQGGKIWFVSTPGAGTTFHFTIPTVELA